MGVLTTPPPFIADELKQREIVSHIKKCYLAGLALGNYDTWKKCVNAKKMQFSKQVSQKDSWFRKYAIYWPLLAELAIILKSAISNLVFQSGTNYVNIKKPGLAGKFLTKLSLYNNEKSAFIQNADQAILNTVVVGQSWCVTQQKLLEVDQQKIPVTELVPVGVDTMVVTPLNTDITQTTSVGILRKRLDELLSSNILYFNLDKIAEKNKGLAPNRAINANTQQKNPNPFDRDKSGILGEGFTIYQAYIHHMDFEDGSFLNNFIATYVEEYDTLIRFEPQAPGLNPWFFLKWGTNLSGDFWAQGPVEQGLPLNGAINTQWLIAMIADILSAIPVYGYTESEDVIESQVKRGELVIKPNALWKLGKDGQIVPLLQGNRTGSIKELAYMMQNAVTNLLGGHVFFSGNTPDGRPDPSATYTNARQTGSNMRVSDVGKIFDEGLIRPFVFRDLKYKQRGFWIESPIIDPFSGQRYNRKKINEQAIQEWMKRLDMNPADMYTPGFLEDITTDVTINDIEITGTQTFVKQQEDRENLIRVNDIIRDNPMYHPFVEPDKLLTAITDSMNLDADWILTQEEQIQQLQGIIAVSDEILMTGVNRNKVDPLTGQPQLLTPEEMQQVAVDKNNAQTRLNELNGMLQMGMMQAQQMEMVEPQGQEQGGQPGPTEVKQVQQA